MVIGDPVSSTTSTSLKRLLSQLQKEDIRYLVDLVQEELHIQPVPKEVAHVLNLHTKVFQELTRLPPSRTQNHVIHLKEGASILNLWSYKYSHHQKNEIEKLVLDMLLKAGMSRPSITPYSRPMIQIKKGWWLAVLCRLQGPQ